MNHFIDQEVIFAENLSEYHSHWISLCNEAEHVQKKLNVVLAQLQSGVDWSPSSQQELSKLLVQRQKIANKIGMLVIFFLQKGIEMPAFPTHNVEEQLSLFDTQAGEKSTQWLNDIVERLGAPKQLENSELARVDLGRIEALLRDMFSWHKYREDYVQSLLEQVVARLRYIQEECPGSLDRHIRKLFHRMTDYSKKHTPGFIHGLSLHHKPRHERWFDDARDSWRDLIALLRPELRTEKEVTEELQAIIVGTLKNDSAATVEHIEAWILSHDAFLHRPNVLRMLMPFRDTLLERAKIKEHQDFCAQLQSFII